MQQSQTNPQHSEEETHNTDNHMKAKQPALSSSVRWLQTRKDSKLLHYKTSTKHKKTKQ